MVKSKSRIEVAENMITKRQGIGIQLYGAKYAQMTIKTPKEDVIPSNASQVSRKPLQCTNVVTADQGHMPRSPFETTVTRRVLYSNTTQLSSVFFSYCLINFILSPLIV